MFIDIYFTTLCGVESLRIDLGGIFQASKGISKPEYTRSDLPSIFAGFLAGQSSSRRPPNKYNSHFANKRGSGEKRPERSSTQKSDRKPGGNFGKSFGKKFGEKNDNFRGKSRSGHQKGEGQDKFSRNRSSGRGDKDGRPNKKRKH